MGSVYRGTFSVPSSVGAELFCWLLALRLRLRALGGRAYFVERAFVACWMVFRVVVSAL